MIAREDIIYLDNNATTEVDPAVLEEMLPFLAEYYGNPSSVYRFGKQAGLAVDTARERVAALLGCGPEEIVFTSCGTESDNAAIAAALSLDRDRQHVVTTAVEHSAIMKQCDALARRGIPVTYLPVDAVGHLDLAALEEAITDETAIVSAMWANNETGVLFPVAEIAAIARAKGVIFHTDAVQAAGKLPVRVADLPVQFLSVAGHKLHAPKGVGALYVNRRTRFQPYLIGGGQESGKRGGTENVASIVGLGKAAELAAAHLGEERTRVRAMRDRFESAVLATISGVERNGDAEMRLPNTSNLAFAGVEAEAALILLDREGVCASAGSACTTGSLHPSHVLTAMGHSAERARSSLRFSFGRFNREPEVDRATGILGRVVEKLRSLRAAGGVVVSGGG